MTTIKKLYDAANVALDVIDDEVAKGFPEPDWAHQLRNAIAEMTPPDPTPTRQTGSDSSVCTLRK